MATADVPPAIYGTESLAGDTMMGFLYDRSIAAIIVTVLAIEAAALVSLPDATRAHQRARTAT